MLKLQRSIINKLDIYKAIEKCNEAKIEYNGEKSRLKWNN